jgi:hypothetical protein
LHSALWFALFAALMIKRFRCHEGEFGVRDDIGEALVGRGEHAGDRVGDVCDEGDQEELHAHA